MFNPDAGLRKVDFDIHPSLVLHDVGESDAVFQ